MQEFFKKIKLAFEDKELRKRILFILFALAIFRFLASIPLPNVNTEALKAFMEQNNFLGLVNIFSGGGLSGLSIVLLGVGPYITAIIIMQLLTVLSPKIKQMYHEEGEAGRLKFAMYSRYLTVVLAALQGFAFLSLLSSQGIVHFESRFDLFLGVLTVVAGTMLLMWVGELATEFGIGSGVSWIIFAGIVASLPTYLSQFIATYDVAMLPVYIAMFALIIAIVAFVVFITEAERPIPITYAKSFRVANASAVSTYLPIKVNQAGVIPIIFAISVLLFPQMALAFLSQAGFEFAEKVAPKIDAFMANTWYYSLAYALLVFAFTYFYTAITFEPHKVAENLQRSNAFIPGIRPGEETVKFLSDIVTRITLFGAIFLAIVAVLPIIVPHMMGISSFVIGGTSVLIAVSVVLDFIKRIEAQLSVREY